jgi:integrase
VRSALAADAGDTVECLFWTGWRKGEALALEWRHVDLVASVIRIEDTKNRDPHTLPYAALPVLAELIAHRRRITDDVQRTRGMKVNHVFHRNGEPIHYLRRSWITACREAGVPGGIPHDYRRSAARNLSRAGVPERVIMELCGWKTRSVFDRYRIVAERDLAEGLAKLAGAYPQQTPPCVRRVAAMTTGR